MTQEIYSLDFEYGTGDEAYTLLENIVDEQQAIDQVGWERMFHNIPQEQLEVMVCLFLGFKPKEIVDILQLPNIVRYYNVSTKLRQSYKERKAECLDYN